MLDGDTLLEADLAKFLEYHLEKKALATIALTRVSNSNRYDLVNTTENGRIRGFLEKKRTSKAFVNTDVYVFEKSILNCISKGFKISLKSEIFPTLLNVGKPLHEYPSSCFFIDMNTSRDYVRF